MLWYIIKNKVESYAFFCYIGTMQTKFYHERIPRMIINLIKSKQMFSLSLPGKIKGQFWVTDLDENGDARQLISIEAASDQWIVKSNKRVSILDSAGNRQKSVALQSQSLINLQIGGSSERVILYADDADESRLSFRKLVAKGPDSYLIGRTSGNHFCFDNKYVSSKHAKLTFTGKNWTIEDVGSTNGTYVNGERVHSKSLSAGDCIFIMGLRIVIGDNYIAMNNPDNKVILNSATLHPFAAQRPKAELDEVEIGDKKYFYRSPRFYREVTSAEITIDPPPQAQKLDTVPLALMLGPSITMGMTSLSTGFLTVSNVMANGGEFSQALPTLIMSVSMLLGTILWPVLTKRYEGKQRIAAEKKRQDKYMAYLEQVRDQIRRKCKEQSEIMQENLVGLDECAARIAGRKPSLWERVIGQSDFLKLRLGVGNVPLEADVKCAPKKFTMEDDNLQDAMVSLGTEPKLVSNVPISVSLTDNKAVGLYGGVQQTEKMLKSMLLQAIALHSYDELKIMLITDETDAHKWDFVRCIPHFWNDEKSERYLASGADEVKALSSYIEKEILARGDISNRSYTQVPPYYLIISTSKKLTEKCDALRQLLKYENNCGCTVIQAAQELKDLPKEAKLVIHVDRDQPRVYDRDDTTGRGITFTADDLNIGMMESLAKSIANIELDISDQSYALPNMLTFLEMFNVGKIEHLNPLTRWKENNPTKTLQTPIGVDTQGEPFLLDLHEKYHGPHGLVAGMTGSGKSEFIITYILSLAVNYHPDEVAFILIDYKGGGLTGAFEDAEKGVKLPHLAGTITNLDGAAVKRSLISIQSELRRRQAIFNEARRVSNEGTMDIYKYQQLYRDKVVKEPVPHLFIISDEFAELKQQQPEFMEQLISAARIGRSLGVHLILATQKPSGVVDDQIWSNSKFRVCLKVQEKSDSQDMIKCPDAAELSQTGRFYLQVGFNELFALGQSAWCGAEYLPSDTVEKSADSSIQIVDNLGHVIMSVKPDKKKSTGPKIKQIVSIVKYLSALAAEENISVRSLWLPPIAEKIYIEALEQKYGFRSAGMVLNPVVGEFDDPFNQKQGVLTVPFTQEGNCLVYGATGNGKTTFLTSLCYSLLKNHSSEELNLYIMDFGSETLKVFEKAPQVGGVVTSSEEEKLVNLLKMLQEEMDRRKSLFSEFGGDHSSYCRRSGKTVPNIVVVLNNIAGFMELAEELLEPFTVLTRDGVKYGIYFAASASSINDVRYKTQQNFKMVLTMQLNDPTDYPVVVGKTDGLIPTKCKGRGLVALDRVYEFQTAYCADTADQQEYLREFCRDLNANAHSYARRIPVLPKVVSLDYVRAAMDGTVSVPVGVAKNSLEIVTVNLSSKVALPVVAQDVADTAEFAAGLIEVLSASVKTVVLDMEQYLPYEGTGCERVTGDFEEFVRNLFAEMVKRNNDYKDAGLDPSVLDECEERVYVICGIKKLFERLSNDGKEKLGLLIAKAESIYKLRFVIIESLAQLNSFAYEEWYKRYIAGAEGLWIGDGVADQYLLKIGKLTNDLYEEIGNEYGYLISKNRAARLKVLSGKSSEEVC